jgi:hypothetical protein
MQSLRIEESRQKICASRGPSTFMNGVRTYSNEARELDGSFVACSPMVMHCQVLVAKPGQVPLVLILKLLLTFQKDGSDNSTCLLSHCMAPLGSHEPWAFIMEGAV